MSGHAAGSVGAGGATSDLSHRFSKSEKSRMCFLHGIQRLVIRAPIKLPRESYRKSTPKRSPCSHRGHVQAAPPAGPRDRHVQGREQLARRRRARPQPHLREPAAGARAERPGPRVYSDRTDAHHRGARFRGRPCVLLCGRAHARACSVHLCVYSITHEFYFFAPPRSCACAWRSRPRTSRRWCFCGRR